MKIYLAGTSVSHPRSEQKLQELFKLGNKLHSFFHCSTGFEKKWFRKNMKNGVNLFLDSGAFSAKTQNLEINIYDYIEFIKTHIDTINFYANLDVIGSPEKTLQNQKIMEKAGLNPIPVFHLGEDPVKFLLPLVKNYNYIALGGMVGTSASQLVAWLDNLFETYLLDNKRFPKLKIHGFGLTSFPLMFRYPWYSVDSTSWVVTGRVGSIFIPRLINSEWNYIKAPLKIAVSSKSPSMKDAGQHISNLSPNQREVFLRYLNEKGYVLGKSEFVKKPQTYELQENEKWAEKKPKEKNEKRLVEIIVEPGISNIYQLRDELNVMYYLEVEKQMPEWPWKFEVKKQNTLF